MKPYNIIVATKKDAPNLTEIFINHLKSNPEYISHGELQMGVGCITKEEGIVKIGLSRRAEQIWESYITEKIESANSDVLKVEENGKIIAFCVVDTEEDGDKPFGMLCDIIVLPKFRGTGVGTVLFNSAISWFKEEGLENIYLESGLNNHSAHEFFEKRGFKKISSIFKYSESV